MASFIAPCIYNRIRAAHKKNKHKFFIPVYLEFKNWHISIIQNLLDFSQLLIHLPKLVWVVFQNKDTNCILNTCLLSVNSYSSRLSVNITTTAWLLLCFSLPPARICPLRVPVRDTHVCVGTLNCLLMTLITAKSWISFSSSFLCVLFLFVFGSFIFKDGSDHILFLFSADRKIFEPICMTFFPIVYNQIIHSGLSKSKCLNPDWLSQPFWASFPWWVSGCPRVQNNVCRSLSKS